MIKTKGSMLKRRINNTLSLILMVGYSGGGSEK